MDKKEFLNPDDKPGRCEHIHTKATTIWNMLVLVSKHPTILEHILLLFGM